MAKITKRELTTVRKQFIGPETQRRTNLKRWILAKYLTRIYTGKQAASRNFYAFGELVFRVRNFTLHRLGWASSINRRVINVSGGPRAGKRGYGLKRRIKLAVTEAIPRGNRLYKRSSPGRPIILRRIAMMRGIFNNGWFTSNKRFIKRANAEFEARIQRISQKAKATKRRITNA